MLMETFAGRGSFHRLLSVENFTHVNLAAHTLVVVKVYLFSIETKTRRDHVKIVDTCTSRHVIRYSLYLLELFRVFLSFPQFVLITSD